MFTKLEQRSWIKIEVARGRSTHEYFHGLGEACGDSALSYRTVVRWVKVFWSGQIRTGSPQVKNNTVQLLASLLDAGHRWTEVS